MMLQITGGKGGCSLLVHTRGPRRITRACRGRRRVAASQIGGTSHSIARSVERAFVDRSRSSWKDLLASEISTPCAQRPRAPLLRSRLAPVAVRPAVARAFLATGTAATTSRSCRRGHALEKKKRIYLTARLPTGMIFHLSEKGKPIERWGRRATGPDGSAEQPNKNHERKSSHAVGHPHRTPSGNFDRAMTCR
jgi:hypothetical protein